MLHITWVFILALWHVTNFATLLEGVLIMIIALPCVVLKLVTKVFVICTIYQSDNTGESGGVWNLECQANKLYGLVQKSIL